MKSEGSVEEAANASVRASVEETPLAVLKEHKLVRKSNERPGEESDSDFESDPPSPKSSEEEEPEEEEEALNSEHGEDTEPENLGQRPLLMDSEEEDEDKRSSDSDPGTRSRKEARPKGVASAPPGSPPGDYDPVTDAFGAVPFPVEPSESADIFAKAPFGQAGGADEPDVFTKAPFGRNLSKPGATPTPAVVSSPDAADVFGFSPFGPAPQTSWSAEDIFRSSFEEPAGPQQQRLKQRSLQRLSSRQRKSKQEAASGANSKRHHGTPTGGRKGGKTAYRTPERARRHKKVGRRDSQSSNEFRITSDSKENISVDMAVADGKDRGASMPADDALLDVFGAKPFHPQDGGRHGHFRSLDDHKNDHKNDPTATSGKTRSGSLHGGLGETRITDDFGAVPFEEQVVHSGPQQQGPPQTVDLDPFGAAPFPSKQ